MEETPPGDQSSKIEDSEAKPLTSQMYEDNDTTSLTSQMYEPKIGEDKDIVMESLEPKGVKDPSESSATSPPVNEEQLHTTPEKTSLAAQQEAVTALAQKKDGPKSASTGGPVAYVSLEEEVADYGDEGVLEEKASAGEDDAEREDTGGTRGEKMKRAGKDVDDDDDRIEDRILIDFYTQSAQKKQVGEHRYWTFRQLHQK
jgi:hypothetical protein